MPCEKFFNEGVHSSKRAYRQTVRRPRKEVLLAGIFPVLKNGAGRGVSKKGIRRGRTVWHRINLTNCALTRAEGKGWEKKKREGQG